MRSELSQVIAACRSAILGTGFLSGTINILALTGSIFMLAVYDRVVPSGSVQTLVGLGILALMMYSLQAGLDIIRSRILTRISLVLSEAFSARAYDVMVRGATKNDQKSPAVVRDMDQVQSFMSSSGLTSLFDLPWIPIYVAVCFLFHPFIGVTVLAGAGILLGLAVAGNLLSSSHTQELNGHVAARSAFMSATHAHAETIAAMGMNVALAARWNRLTTDIAAATRAISDTSGSISSVSRVFRMILQSFVLAFGAFLVIRQEATGGIMIASSILAGRALAPIDTVIANWKNLTASRQAWGRLTETLQNYPVDKDMFALPAPAAQFGVEGISVAPPNAQKLVLKNVSFSLRAGQSLGLVGATGSGKSSLAKTLVGLWHPLTGSVRYDGNDIQRWNAADRGRFIGYVPQKIALFNGTIAENIARFDPSADKDSVTRAAKAAGVEDLIARLPDGYDTVVDQSGGGLSGGQMQQIALARALYGEPFVVILDEPNSNLDAVGEAALLRAMESVTQRAGIVIVIAHRASVLANVDLMMVLQNGMVSKYGPYNEVINGLPRPGNTNVA